MSKLDSALALLAQGYWIIPIHWMVDGRCSCGEDPCPKSPGKHPRSPHGEKDATDDPEQIRKWWRRWPDANMAIATGPSELTVVDVDGPEGQAQLRSVSGGNVPPTLGVATGRQGGFHLYYRGKTCKSSQVAGEHLDVRGKTGYVIAPGSIHPNGTPYRWANQVPIADVPEWVEPWVNSRSALGGTHRAQGVTLHSFAELAKHLPAYVTQKALAAPALAARGLTTIENTPYTPYEHARLRSALLAIPAAIDGKVWVSIGHAIKDLKWIVNGVDVCLELYDEWSDLSEGEGPGNHAYPGRAGIEKRWASYDKPYNGLRSTVATIYALAKTAGWDGTVIPLPETTSGEVVNGTNGVHVLGPAFSNQNTAILFPDRNKVGQPTATCRNTRVAIRGLGLACAHDLFHDKLQIGGQAIGEWAGDLTDNAVHMLRVAVEKEYGFDPGTVNAHDAAVQECLQGAFDPVVDYLDGLTWDRIRRLDTWLATYLGADRSGFTAAVGRLCLVAAVRRARQPGCKFDQIVVLEGPEGRGKSSAIELLAESENFSDQTILTLDDKGQQEALAGVWIFEIADFAGMGKADIEKTKAFASRKADRARPAYGRMRVNQPRRCICFATTNNDTYLKSQTGNRRFWPVRCGRIDLAGLARDRDQLWAEAAWLEAQGVSLELPEALWVDAARLQEDRRDHDPWDELLAGDIGKVTADGRERRISSREIMEGRLALPADKQNDVTAKRVAFTMRRLGWDGPKLLRDDATVCRGYTKPVTAVTG